MDWGSLAGILLALIGVVFGQVIDGGRLGALVQPAAFLIVMCGTVGAVLLQSGLPTFVRGIRMAARVFKPPVDDEQHLLAKVTMWSATARRDGLLSLERFLDKDLDPFIEKGLRLVVDGIDPYKIRETLDIAISVYETEQRLAVKVWESAGGYAPTVAFSAQCWA